MLLFNCCDDNVFCEIDGRQILLQANSTAEIDCKDEYIITLKHNYKSRAMSIKQISKDDMDTSAVSLLLSGYKDPYFDIVLTCTYKIKVKNDSEIHIKKEIIRPVYTCSYDRLYPVICNGTVDDVMYVFPERKLFESHYKKAVGIGNKTIINILCIVLFVFSMPIILISLLSRTVLGAVIAVLNVMLLLLIKAVGMLIAGLISNIDYSIVFREFDSQRIMEHFKKH